MKFGSLFSGIGGIDLGLERAGMKCSWQVEIDEFCQKVLNKHWPDVPKHKDIKNVGKENLERVDLIAGGFPCQPFSLAGRRKGTEDSRHLWPEMLRVISELRPKWVLGENVPGIISVFLDQAISDLEAEGYKVESFVLPACAFDAQHRRDRLFIIGFMENSGRTHEEGNKIETKHSGQDREGMAFLTKRPSEPFGLATSAAWKAPIWASESGMDRVAYGIPNGVDRLKSLGNAVVPQVIEHIGRIIWDANIVLEVKEYFDEDSSNRWTQV